MAATRRARLIVVALVAVVLLGGGAFAVRTWFSDGSSPFVADSCSFQGYDVDPGQASVAATMIGAVTRYRTELPVRAQVLVLAAAMQESKLRNIAPGDGDRDSVGVLQQRPSQGWGGGSAQALTDVGRATTEFLDALVKVDGWQTMPPAEAIQAVQISFDGSLYAQHVPQATVMAAALSGRTPRGITCEFDDPTDAAAASAVATQLNDELGIDTATAPDARTVRVPGAGWQSAAWFVANADRLGVASVAYSGRRWTQADGWTTSSTAAATSVTATMAKV